MDLNACNLTMQDHARRIQEAINEAAQAGYELDDGDGEPLYCVELNHVVDGDMTDPEPIEIHIPCTFWG